MTQYVGYLDAGQAMIAGDILVPWNCNVELAFNGTSLALTQYAPGGKTCATLWQQATPGGSRAVLTPSGDFQVLDAAGTLIWNTRTSGAGNRLVCQPDGALALVGPGGSVAMHPAGVAVAGSTSYLYLLYPGQQLDCTDVLWSPNGRYRLVMQPDGNLVLYAQHGNIQQALWATGTVQSGGQSLVVQLDSNLVLYTAGGETSGHALWDSGTSVSQRQAGGLNLFNDGQLALSRGGKQVWSSGSAQDDCTSHMRFLDAGQSLAVGDSLLAANLGYSLSLQSDGELALCRFLATPGADGAPCQTLWAAGTRGRAATGAVMQGDGNFVVYAGSQPLWGAGSNNSTSGNYLFLEDTGNLSVVNGSQTFWSSHSTQAPRRSIGTLGCGLMLEIGDTLVSPNGLYQLALGADGDLVWSVVPGGRVLWHSATAGQGGHELVMQTDGNLVLYSIGGEPRGAALWASHTSKYGPSALKAQDDGNLVVYDDSGGGTARWSSHTVQSGQST